MKTKITIIVDNIPAGELLGEWGLSILVEYNDKKILLDAGASELFAENLKKLGFDISEIDFAVLSHAHSDHADGMPKFFEKNEKAKLFVRETTDENCYYKKFVFKKYIGICRNMLSVFKDRIEYVSGDYKLCDGVYLIPHKTSNLRRLGRREMMYCHTKRGWHADDFSHEQSLVLDTDKGLIILNSCSHGGALNIINEVQSTFPEKHIYAYIGGLHLFNKTTKEIMKVAGELKETDIEYIYTGHCTKNRAFGLLKDVLGDRLTQLKVGMEIDI